MLKLSCFIFSVFLFTTLLFNTPVAAQEYKVKMSEPAKFFSEKGVVDYGSGYFGFTINKTTLQYGFSFKLSSVKMSIKLTQLDAAFKVVKETELSDGKKVYSPFEPQLKKINEKLYLIYSQFAESGGNDIIKFWAAEVDTMALQLKPAKELLSIDPKDTKIFKNEGIPYYYKLLIGLSPDKSKLAVAWTPYESNQYHYSVLDAANLSLIWTRNSTIPDNKKLSLSSCAIDNSSTIYMGFSSKEGEGKFKGSIVTGQQNGQDKLTLVQMGETFPYQVHFVTDKTGKPTLIAGTYLAGSDIFAGVYTAPFNAESGSIGAFQTTPYSDELLALLSKNDWAVKGGKRRGIIYYPTDVVELEDGSFNLIGELERGMSVGDGTHSYTLSGNVVGAHIKNGAVTFFQVPKYRVSAVRRFGANASYYIAKNTTVVFYTDLAENLEKGIDESMSNSKRFDDLVLVAATIENGKLVKRKLVVDLNKENYLAFPNAIVLSKAGTILMPFAKIKGPNSEPDYTRLAEIAVQIP